MVLLIEPVIHIPAVSFGLISEAQPKFLQARYESVAKVQLVNAVERRNSILLVGDVMLARNVEFIMQKEGFDYPYKGLNFNDIAINPYVVGNFESSIPRIHVPTEILKMKFSVNPILLSSAWQAGFTHFSLANNHTLDYGKTDFENTKNELTSVGFKVFGYPSKFSTDSITTLTLENRTVSIIGLHALVQKPSSSEIKNVLNHASKKSDFQIVYVHWGDEYMSKSNEDQKKLAKELVSAGADMIVGHHPHVVQEVELIDGVPVFYSLGNYIFDQYFSTEVQQGLLLHLGFDNQPLIHLIPVTSEHSLSQPTHMNEKETLKFLRELALRSDPSLKDYIQAGVLPLNRSFATSSKMAMINR